MKIRNPYLIQGATWLGSKLMQGLIRSLRLEYHAFGPTVMPPPVQPNPRYMFVLWHETLIIPITQFANPHVTALVSQHTDGQILADFMKSLGMNYIFGSSTRGGIQAVREMIRDVNRLQHLAITPDGPRGPRRVVQSGAIYIAAKTGMQIAPLGIGLKNAWRTNSWDRFAIPKPCSRVKILSAAPITLPKNIRTDSLEDYCQQIQAELDRLTRLAELWADTNILPNNE